MKGERKKRKKRAEKKKKIDCITKRIKPINKPKGGVGKWSYCTTCVKKWS